MQLPTASSDGGTFARQLDAVSWGLFIIWIGVALLMDVGWGWGLLGVAAIILATTVVRRFKALPIHGFWVAMGLILVVCALWELFAVSWPLIPILLIGFGLAVLLGAFRGPRGRPA